MTNSSKMRSWTCRIYSCDILFTWTFHNPDTPCMQYMPTLTPKTTPIDRQSGLAVPLVVSGQAHTPDIETILTPHSPHSHQIHQTTTSLPQAPSPTLPTLPTRSVFTGRSSTRAPLPSRDARLVARSPRDQETWLQPLLRNIFGNLTVSVVPSKRIERSGRAGPSGGAAGWSGVERERASESATRVALGAE